MCLGGVAHENASPVGGDRVHSVPPLGAQLPKAGFHQSCILQTLVRFALQVPEFWVKVKIPICFSDGGEPGS